MFPLLSVFLHCLEVVCIQQFFKKKFIPTSISLLPTPSHWSSTLYWTGQGWGWDKRGKGGRRTWVVSLKQHNHIRQCQWRVRVSVFSCLSYIWFFETLWTVAHQAPLSMGFSRQEYWSGLPCPPPGESSPPREWTHVSFISCIGRWVLYTRATWEAPFTTQSFLKCLPSQGCLYLSKMLREHQSSCCYGSVIFAQFSSVAQLCLIPCYPMDCSMPGFPVHH